MLWAFDESLPISASDHKVKKATMPQTAETRLPPAPSPQNAGNGLLARLIQRFTGKAGGDDQAAVRPLWHSVVTLGREKAWYLQGGASDSVAGRFDVVTLVLCLVLLRMERSADLKMHCALLTELFVTDMDGQLRESGVGDLVVGKHIGRLMSVLGGRLGAYRAALDPQTGSDEALEQAITRNLTLRADASPAAATQLAASLAEHLAKLPDDELLSGALRGTTGAQA